MDACVPAQSRLLLAPVPQQLPRLCPAPTPVQLTFYQPTRSGFEFSARLSCPGTMGPPLCLAELERDMIGGGPPRLVWGDTGERRLPFGSRRHRQTLWLLSCGWPQRPARSTIPCLHMPPLLLQTAAWCCSSATRRRCTLSASWRCAVTLKCCTLGTPTG